MINITHDIVAWNAAVRAQTDARYRDEDRAAKIAAVKAAAPAERKPAKRKPAKRRIKPKPATRKPAKPAVNLPLAPVSIDVALYLAEAEANGDRRGWRQSERF